MRGAFPTLKLGVKHLFSAFGVLMVNLAGSCNTKENCHFLYEKAASGFKAVFVRANVH